VAHQDDVCEIAALDFIHHVVDRVSQPEARRGTVIRQSREGQRKNLVTAGGEEAGHRLPGPASKPCAGNQNERLRGIAIGHASYPLFRSSLPIGPPRAGSPGRGTLQFATKRMDVL